MRRTTLFTLMIPVLAACGSDPGPAEVAQQFHTLRVDGNDRAVYAMLTDADRAAVPAEAFPTELPTPLMLELLGWGDAGLDSAAVLDTRADTARVILQVEGGERDTVRLVASRRSEKVLWLIDRERVDWRVSLRLAEWAVLDSLATALRADAGATDSAAVARAEAYLDVAGRLPSLARATDLDAARSTVRAAAVAEALEIELRRAEAVSGTPFVDGHVANLSERRINTLRLVVADAAGREEVLELWDIPAGGRAPIWRITRLGRGPLTYRVDAIRIF